MPGNYARLGSYTVGIVTITPEAAQEVLLSHMAANRTPVTEQVALLTEHIKGGTFVITGEPLIFDATEKMINGRHRLTACCRAKLPIPAMLVLGVANDVFRYIDQQARRRISQILQMIGEFHTKALSGAISTYHAFLCTGIPARTGATERLGVDAAIDILGRNGGLRESATLFRGPAKSPKWRNPASVAALHYVFSHVNPSLATDFVTAVASGTIPSADPKWGAVRALLKCLDNNLAAAKKYDFKHLSALIIKAWNNLARGLPAKSLRWDEENEPFPQVYGWRYENDAPALDANGCPLVSRTL